MNDTTTQTEQRSAQLVMLDQQLALGAYLQALLKPPEETVAVEPKAMPVVDMAVEAETVVMEVPQQVAPSEPTAERMPAPIPELSVVATPVQASPHPDWAVGDFQCLLFRVAGLTLALPLAKLHGVLPWDDAAVTPMPGHQSWFLGLREYQGQKVRLIDVADVIVPRESAAPTAGYGKVILIGGGGWGLVCTDVAEVVTLAPTAVKWRGRSGNRPWLAGTVIERMCALIDADAFAEMLATEGPAAG